MRPFAKASSAGSTKADGRSRGLFRRALATRGASSDVKGSGAPSTRHLRGILAVLALAFTAFAMTAAPALAATPTATCCTVSNVSYTSAHLTGKLTSDGGLLGFSTYVFQYSTDPTDPNSWKNGSEEREISGVVTDAEVEGNISVPKGGTEYFVRLYVHFFFDEATSPAPYTSFTTLAVAPPVIVTTDDASEVFSKSAKLSGEVERPAGDSPAFDVTACRFEYVTDEQFGTNGFADADEAGCEGFTPITAPGPGGKQGVTAHLTELKAATTYHLRLAAENAGPTAATKEAADTFTTLPSVAKPTVLTANDATDVTKRTAKVSGSVERPAGADPALDTSCRFEYVTEEQFTTSGFEGAEQTPCVQAPPEAPLTSPGPTPVTAELSGLASSPTGVTYHLRLAAENGGGTDTKDAAAIFTTLPIIRPSVAADPLADAGYTTADVSGVADPGNQGLFGTFEWAIDPDLEGWTNSHRSATFPETSFLIFAGEPSAAVHGHLTKLLPGTTYQYRVGATDQESGSITDVYSTEPYPEFTTKGTSTPPSASLDPVAEITGTGAHFSGTVDPHAPAEALDEEGKAAYRTAWRIECSPACPGAPSGTVEGEEGAQQIDFHAHDLDTSTPYQVKLIAENVLGTVESEQTFETPLVKPSVRSLPGGSDGEGGYILAGVVNPNHSEITACEFKWGPNSASYAFSAPCSPTPGNGNQPVTVEAHLTGLNPGLVYNADLVIKSATFGEAHSGNFEFTPTLAAKESCPNEQLRKENNSLSLPECRAYEMVTDPHKGGFGANLVDFSSDALQYQSGGRNLANSGLGLLTEQNPYVAVRSAAGWQTIPDLNGPSGSPRPAPSSIHGAAVSPTSRGFFTSFLYSADLRSSIMPLERTVGPPAVQSWFRRPDGSFALVGVGGVIDPAEGSSNLFGASDDLAHLLISSPNGDPTSFGPGVYEFVGTGNAQPRRVDVDNLGAPVCAGARAKAISTDGRVIVFAPCDTSIWARVDGTTSYDVSVSQCSRPDCNAPVAAVFKYAASDGSRVYFTTTQQLINGDTDQTNDLYACDIPTAPQAPVGTANPCSALHRVSAGVGPAKVQEVLTVSDDGSTAYFTAKGVLADNEDALGEPALAGDENLYVWRTDAAHPDGQTTFVASLPESDNRVAQTTSDGRYLVLQTRGRLLQGDTDNSLDIYRYDAASVEMARVSTGVSGAGGNGEFDARLDDTSIAFGPRSGATPHHSHPAISDNGETIVFITSELLSPNGSGNSDVYLWKAGHVREPLAPSSGNAVVDGSGQDVYIETAMRLTPADGDFSSDVYDARIDGGFAQHQEGCTGESCQPSASSPPVATTPATNRPAAEPGNVKPKTCPKGKVEKHGKCVKKTPKKHSGGKHQHQKKKHQHQKKNQQHKSKRTAANKQGGGK